MLNIHNLFSLSYWFSLQAPLLNKFSLYIWLIVNLIIILGAVGLQMYSPRLRQNPSLAKFMRRLSHPLFFFGIVSFIFLFFRQEKAYFLSARFWLALLMIGFIVWVVMIAVKFLKTYKQDLSRLAKEKEFRKYLPR